MKYFIDTEFSEGTQKETFPISLFRKNTPNTIDLISIGIVAEDGREYYAISKDFNLKEAWNRYEIKETSPAKKYMGFYEEKVYWIRDHVLKPIFDELFSKSLVDKGSFVRDNFFTAYSGFTYGHLRALINYYGKTNKEIADEIQLFVYNGTEHPKINADEYGVTIQHEFYAYYADYGWVVFCWLFGKMMDLPNGFPMYCKDLKQILDEKINTINNERGDNKSPLVTFESIKKNYPYLIQDPSKSHNSLEDARWNKQLFEFLNKL